eukprot:COSAG01_NODE_18502_length_1071_cov_17.038066_2_plen_94_part_00
MCLSVGANGIAWRKEAYKQPKCQDLVGSWIAIQYDDDSATGPDGIVDKVWYNGLVTAYDENLISYQIAWEVRLLSLIYCLKRPTSHHITPAWT